jgi:DNA polymerase-1
MGKPQVTFVASSEAFAEAHKVIKTTSLETPIALDVEASSLDPSTGTLILLQIATKKWVYIFDVRQFKKGTIKSLLLWLNKRKLVGHNFKFDMKYLFNKYDVMLSNVHDTMLAEAIIHAGVGNPFTKYDDLVEKYCYVQLEKELRKEFEDSPDVIITPELIEYSANDVIFIPYIYELQMEELAERKSLNVYGLEMRLLPVVSDMESWGVTLDREKWAALLETAKEHAKRLDKEIRDIIFETVEKYIKRQKFEDARPMLEFFKVKLRGEHKKVAYSREFLSTVTDDDKMVEVFFANFNPGSTYQMQRIMNLMGIPVESTDSKYLKRDFKEYEFVTLLVDYRHWSKMVSSFGENFYEEINPVTKKIHSNFDQLATRTGRFASSGPNLQNVERAAGYRNSFIASPDYKMATADYSQIELRLAAEASKEENMLSAFREGRDLHAETAIGSFGIDVDIDKLDPEIRTKGKSLNFAIIYGTSAKGIAYNFEIPHKEGLAILERHRDMYPDLHNFIDVSREKILVTGHSVTPFGRRRYFTIPSKFNRFNMKEKFKIYKEGFNHIIQGGSADMLKIAMVKIYERNPFAEQLRALMSIHDEIVYEIHDSILEEGEEFIRNEMISAGEMFIKSVPVEVGIKVAPYWEK